ncbi:MAG: hypothetical protein GY943_11140 [Chloroflexi bacterium]|nr:hypothetical protein [Chloroflexota bacterium]
MNGRQDTPSSALLAAQQQLFARRKQLLEAGPLVSADKLPFTADKSASSKRPPTRSCALPAHLGWGSAPLTAVLRNANDSHSPGSTNHAEEALRARDIRSETVISPSQTHATWTPNPHDTIKVFPDIARGMLRNEQTAAGRIWLLLRYLDREGKGWLRIASCKKALATKITPIRICGWRQLRNLLRQGEGILWTRDKTRIWLKSAANVAAALEVERLTGKPVSVPVHVFTGSIGHVRSHLYAAFHSGRSRDDQRQPIARETLTELTGVGRCTQLTYESHTGLAVQHNYAVGERYSSETAVKHAWHHGQATFVLQDSYGEQGKPGRSYIAWQLPNSYGSCHPHAPKGRQRRINRKLKDLVTTGAPGNNRDRLDTRYYPDGKLAVKTASRHPEWDVYWWRQRTRNGRSDMWQQVG